MIMTADDVYLLVEPRFFKNNTHFNISIFSLPEDTVKNFLFIDDTLGVDLNLYTNAISYNENIWTFGAHTSVTFVDKSFMDIKNYKKITENGFNINLTPYFSRNFLSGELHGQIKIKVMNFATGKWYNAFNTAIGYKTRL